MKSWFERVKEALDEVEWAARTYNLGRYRRGVQVLKDLASDTELEP